MRLLPRSRWRRTLALAGGITAVAGSAIWGIEREVVRRARRRPDPDAGSDFELAYDAHRMIATRDGGKLAVYSRGSGATIVFSHGATLAAQVWVKQFADLPRRGFRVVAYDQRGHGSSDVGDDGHSPRALAADVRSVLETLDLHDAVLVGHSMGGLAVGAFAAWHRAVAMERVRGIVMVGALARTMLGDTGRAVVEQIAEHAPDYGALFTRPDLGFVVTRLGFGRSPQPSHVEFVRRLMVSCSADTRHAVGPMLLDADLSDELPTIEIPVLVVGGTADLLTPPAGARHLAGLIPGARLEILDGAGHLPMLERADELDDLIAAFATEVGA